MTALTSSTGDRRAGATPSVQAMASADVLFRSAADAQELVLGAARLLACDLGQLCLISVSCGSSQCELHPVALAHARRVVAQRIGQILGGRPRPRPDAFSREVQRTGGSLRLHLRQPSMIRLWLPGQLAVHAERAGVSSILATALATDDQVLGAMMLWREGGQPGYDRADEDYVRELARRLGIALQGYASHEAWLAIA